MSTSKPDLQPRAVDASVDDDELLVVLADGRRLAVPLVWFPRLLQADSTHRSNWRFIGQGEGIHWPDIDEDLSAEEWRGSAAPDSPGR